MRLPSGFLIGLVISLLPLSPVAAGPLAERVPEEAIIYLGWAGAEPQAEAFEQSHVRKLLEDSKLRHVLTQTLSTTVHRIAEQEREPGLTMLAEALEELAPMLWDRPWALYFAGLDEQAGMPRLGLLVEAGNQQDAFRGWVERVQQLGVPIQAVDGEGYIGGVLDMAWRDPANGGLSANDRFQDAVAPMRDRPEANELLLGYVDVQAITTVAEQMNATDTAVPPGQPQPPVDDIVSALGLDGVEHVAFSAGLEGPRWFSRAFVAAPAPRRGVAKWLLDGDPLEAPDLDLVPDTASWFFAGRFDLADLYDALEQAAGELDPNAPEHLRQGLANVGMMADVDIEQDLLRSLGPTWVLHRDATVAGPGSFLGLTLVNEPRDPERLTDALNQLGTLANRMSQPNREGEPHLRFVDVEHGDATIQTFTFMFVNPSWAIDDGRLYVGLMPQSVANAIDHARDGGPSIRENEWFQAVAAQLGDRAGTTLTFTDLPQTAPVVYGNTMMFAQILPSVMVAFDAEADGAPLMVVPTLGQLQPLLEPAGQVTWSDEAGWHAHNVTPFPGAEILGHEGSSSPAVIAMGAGIMLPALSRAREAANRTVSISNARNIFQAMAAHAAVHRGRMPDDVWTLLELELVTVDTLLAPGAPVEVPPDFHDRPGDEQAAWVRRHASYVLLPGPENEPDPNVVTLFQRPEHSLDGDQIAVAFADGHVESMVVHRARQLVEQQTGRTLQQLIERQQNLTDDDG